MVPSLRSISATMAGHRSVAQDVLTSAKVQPHRTPGPITLRALPQSLESPRPGGGASRRDRALLFQRPRRLCHVARESSTRERVGPQPRCDEDESVWTREAPLGHVTKSDPFCK